MHSQNAHTDPWKERGGGGGGGGGGGEVGRGERGGGGRGGEGGEGRCITQAVLLGLCGSLSL